MVKGVNDIPTTAPWMIPYFSGGEEEASHFTRSCSKEFIPICPYCGRLGDKPITPNALSKLHGISCICKDGITIPNKIIREIANQALDLGLISFKEKEYKEYDSDGVQRRFDMMIRDIDGNPYFIEMDGGYHGDVKQKHSTKMVFIPCKYFVADMRKDEIAKSLNIPLIRVDCYKSEIDYIKKNLYESDVAKIINLDLLDWKKIGEVCFNNLMAEICKYKADHKDAKANDVAKLFDVSNTTVRTYWHEGTSLGLCYYDAKEEALSWTKDKKNWYQSVPVLLENLDTGESWNFPSRAEFIRNAEDIFSSRFTNKMLDGRLKKTTGNFIIYESPSTKEKYRITLFKKEDIDGVSS